MGQQIATIVIIIFSVAAVVAVLAGFIVLAKAGAIIRSIGRNDDE